MPHVPRCPACEKPVEPRSKNRAHPFCSDRCRAVDLGKWLGEEYRVPDRSADEREDGQPFATSAQDDYDA